jgi:hypothetical protein
MLKRGVEKGIGVSRGVLALSHRKQSEDFSKKNRRIVIEKTSSPTPLYPFPRERLSIIFPSEFADN